MNEYSITVQILVVQNLNVQPHTASKCQNQSSRTGWSAGSKLTQTCQAALRPWAHQLSHWWLSTSTTQGLSSKPFRIPCLKQFISSVHFSHSGISNSLWPHGLQHARLPWPSPFPRACSNSRPSSRWCHPTISSSVIHFSSYLQSFPASGSFPMSQFFTSGGKSIGVSALASVLPMNIQDWFSLGLTGWSSCSPRDSQESSPTPHYKSINSSALSFLYSRTLISIHYYCKNHSLD